MAYILLAIAIVAEVIATSFLKRSNGFTNLVPSIVATLGYVVAFYSLSRVLGTIPTGIAYAIWSGAGIVLIVAVAWILHGQKLDAPAIIGMSLIVSGVVVMNVFSRTATLTH